MEVESIIKTYGNKDLPNATPERPLVTFAVFAYNQEKYIQEAIEGAFSQTYSPLEIILSDDCSSDKTFEIMEEMAKSYNGPHKVVVRRGGVNLGTALHVSLVSKISRGELIFVAAGDDISEPSRCDVVVQRWLEEGKPSCCIHSAAMFFDDENSSSILAPARTPNLNADKCREFALRDTLPFLSPTCVYARDLFFSYEPRVGGSIIEDGVMALRSLSSGRLISINKPLVHIRKQSETAGTGYSIYNPRRWNKFIISRIISYHTMLRDVCNTRFDSLTKRQLQKIYILKIRRLSLFIIPEDTSVSGFKRIMFFVRYVLFYPSSGNIVVKFACSAKISGILYKFKRFHNRKRDRE